MNIPKKDQIAAILEVTEWKLAREYGLQECDISWNITKKEVQIYIARNGFPKGWVYFSEQTYDGVYVLEVNNEWIVSYKERGIVHYESRFTTKEKAMDFLLDEYYLKRKGIS